jgi:hypothetical protein
MSAKICFVQTSITSKTINIDENTTKVSDVFEIFEKYHPTKFYTNILYLEDYNSIIPTKLNHNYELIEFGYYVLKSYIESTLSFRDENNNLKNIDIIYIHHDIYNIITSIKNTIINFDNKYNDETIYEIKCYLCYKDDDTGEERFDCYSGDEKDDNDNSYTLDYTELELLKNFYVIATKIN